MWGRHRMASAGAVCVLAVAVAVPAALATTGDKDDSVAPAGKTITLNLKKGTLAQFTATVYGTADTVSCHVVSASFTNAGNTAATLSNPKFSQCTDSIFSSPTTITTNSKNGHWKAFFVDAASDEKQKESGAGDHVELQIPKAGATVVNQTLSSCHVIAAPTGPATIKASYDDKSVANYNMASFPVKGNGCTTGKTATLTATFVYSPGVHDKS